ncbi:MAG: hypothetical protein GY749_11125 [Desulfobacteraceae bacterium]|nr:hypothetical protein [Desulfobacteraceae bacterium]
MSEYLKYAYWLVQDEFELFRDNLAANGKSMIEGKKAVCRPLAKNVEIGFVPPEAWRKTELCKRPLSWYWISPYAGKYLVISSFDLKEYGLSPDTILRANKFCPGLLPNGEEKQNMIQRKSYLQAKPDEWDNLPPGEDSKIEKWMKVMGIRRTSFKELFLTHCANHANFIEPVYFIQDGDEIIPYSIGKTKFLCSACLEFFNVIGGEFRKKMVVPCPGAVLFAGLPVNKYIEVETVSS